MEDISTKHPEYHNLKYSNQNLSFEIVRNKILGDKRALLSFTETEDFLYVIIANATKENFLRLPFGPVERKLVRDFYKAISKPALNNMNSIELMSRELYSVILQRRLAGNR